MIGIVRIALLRPLTFIVMAILILIIGVLSAVRTPVDIFPNIGVPVIATAWQYSGLSPGDMSGRIIYYYERTLTTTVSGIERIVSQSYYGSGVVKIYFQPGTDIAAAQAQVTASSQTVIKQLPAGTTPPNILVFDASSVPVLDLQVAAENMTPAQINDITSNIASAVGQQDAATREISVNAHRRPRATRPSSPISLRSATPSARPTWPRLPCCRWLPN